MGMEKRTYFELDKTKCVKCGNCVNVCSGMVLEAGKDDLLFCGAPHLFIAHERCVGKWAEDSKVNCNLATAYFELLASAFGLGTVIMSYPADVLRELAPTAREMLNIPADHYMNLIVGFGCPEIIYARGVQKERGSKIHRSFSYLMTKPPVRHTRKAVKAAAQQTPQSQPHT